MLEMRLLAARRESSIGLERSATCGLFLVQRGNLNGQSKYLGRHALARTVVWSVACSLLVKISICPVSWIRGRTHRVLSPSIHHTTILCMYFPMFARRAPLSRNKACHAMFMDSTRIVNFREPVAYLRSLFSGLHSNHVAFSSASMEYCLRLAFTLESSISPTND